MGAGAPVKVTTTALSISRWIISLSGPWKAETSGSVLANWLKVAFEREMQSGSAEPYSPTYVTPNVIVIGLAGPIRLHGGSSGKTDVVIVLPSGMFTSILVPPEGGGIGLMALVGALLQVNVIAVMSKPGHPVRNVDGSVGHGKAVGVIAGVGVPGGVFAGWLPGQPVKDRDNRFTVATTVSSLTVLSLFMIILPHAVVHRRSSASGFTKRKSRGTSTNHHLTVDRKAQGAA